MNESFRIYDLPVETLFKKVDVTLNFASFIDGTSNYNKPLRNVGDLPSLRRRNAKSFLRILDYIISGLTLAGVAG
jgi:hypothetical protein